MISNLTSPRINGITLRLAIISALSYVAFFALIKFTGLPYTEWIYSNYLIFCIAAWNSLKAADNAGNSKLGYLRGVRIAITVGTLSFVFFGIFIYVYSYFGSFFNDMVFHTISSVIGMKRWSAPVIIVTEGVVICAILSLGLIQLYRVYRKPGVEGILT